ncbi:hypothetical protein BRC89_01245 [Halobacteriales archaeon QS_4_70_19]|nr:MAG: hypothetical protein BRC89_01245 [Halobacteriales archaeon QS_4_70_19]
MGRSRGIKFACDGTARFGTCGQDGEAAGLVPAVLHLVSRLVDLYGGTVAPAESPSGGAQFDTTLPAAD